MTLDEAIQQAVENHPRVKMAQLDLQRVGSQKGEAWDPGNTQVQYSRGQLNGETKSDYELSVEQSLGSLLTPHYKQVLTKTQLKTGEHRLQLTENEVKAEVKRAWTDYLAALEVCRLYRGQDRVAEQLRHISQLRYEQGLSLIHI